MHYVVAILLGLLALVRVQGRALPDKDLTSGERATLDLDFTHISDYPLDDPRNNGLVGPLLADKPQRGGYTLAQTHKDGLEKRVTAGGSPATRPPPTNGNNGRPGNNGKPDNKPRLGRPNANEEPDSAAMAIERAALSDTSDIVKVPSCRVGKRRLGELAVYEALPKRMSGQEKALTWEEWQKVFDEVDSELATLGIGKKVRIIFMGGISGIALGSRGAEGKTGDADFSFHVDTPQNVRDILKTAIDRIVAKNPDKFEVITGLGKPDPMNDQWDKHTTDWAKASLSRQSQMIAYEGNYLTGIHGDWKMQLLSKMKRISEWRSRSTEFKERDQQDAKVFLQKVQELMGKEQDLKGKGSVQELTMEQFVSWGDMIGMDREQTESAVRVSLKIVAGNDMPGIEQKIKDDVNKMKC